MSIEMERTYILKGTLEELVDNFLNLPCANGYITKSYKTFTSSQFNLVKDDNVKLRCRKNNSNDVCELCVKIGTGNEREEYEFKVQPSVFDNLYPHSIDGYANKTCHVWEFGTYDENDNYLDYEFAIAEVNNEFIYLDVEIKGFNDEARRKAMGAFHISAWIPAEYVDYEVLKDVELRNVNSAGGLNYGRPEEGDKKLESV